MQPYARDLTVLIMAVIYRLVHCLVDGLPVLLELLESSVAGEVCACSSVLIPGLTNQLARKLGSVEVRRLSVVADLGEASGSEEQLLSLARAGDPIPILRIEFGRPFRPVRKAESQDRIQANLDGWKLPPRRRLGFGAVLVIDSAHVKFSIAAAGLEP